MGGLILELLRPYLPDATERIVRERMSLAVNRIAEQMSVKGITPDKVGAEMVVRDALFRLWRSVIPSGDIADFIRDRSFQKVWAKVQPEARDKLLVDLVMATEKAALEVVF